MRKYLYLAMCLLCAVAKMQAQEVTGCVTDEQGQPVEYVNVVLLQNKDSVFISGCITDEAGKFLLSGLTEAAYLLKVSSIGYEPILLTVPANGKMGKITMKQSSVVLGEVVVKGNLPATRMKGGKLVTGVENSFLAHAGTANDVLSQVPMVLGKDGSFEVFGKGTPLIYINGRQVHDTNDLAQLNSQDIKSVEVITNPGAQYDASVKSVIRIRTKRPQGEGFSGTLRANNGFAHYFRTGEQLDLKYRTKGLELFTTLGYYGGKSYETSENDMTTLSETIWRQIYEDTNKQKYHEMLGKLGFDYMVNDKHSIGAYYQNGYNKHTNSSDYHSDILADNELYDRWNNQSHTVRKQVPRHFTNAYYNGSIKKLGIDFNIDYMWNKDRKSAFNDEQSENYNDAEVETRSLARSRLFAEKLIFSYPIWKGELEIGQEYTSSRLASGFNTTATSLADATTQVDENNHAVFIQLSQQLGRFSASAGMRYEHVNFNYYENGMLKPERSKTYNNVFPSLSVSTMIGKVQTALSYTNKTVRPSYSRLDGTVNYINRFTYQSGNPYLKPTTLHSIELMAAWQMFFAQLSYNYAKNPINNATQPYSEDERIKLITYDNFPENKTLNAFVGTSLQWGIWQPKINIGIIKQWFSVPYNGEQKELNKPMPLIQFQNAIHLPADIWLNIDAQWRGGGNTENVYFRSNSYVNAKLYKSFFKNRFSLTVEAKDILNKSHENFTFYNGDVTIDAINHNDSRSFFVTLQYNFNTSRNRYKGTGAGEAEKARF